MPVERHPRHAPNDTCGGSHDGADTPAFRDKYTYGLLCKISLMVHDHDATLQDRSESTISRPVLMPSLPPAIHDGWSSPCDILKHLSSQMAWHLGIRVLQGLVLESILRVSGVRLLLRTIRRAGVFIFKRQKNCESKVFDLLETAFNLGATWPWQLPSTQ